MTPNDASRMKSAAERVGRATALVDLTERSRLNFTPQPSGGQQHHPPPLWVVRVTGAVLPSGLYPAVCRELTISGSAGWQDAADEQECYAYHVAGLAMAVDATDVGLFVCEAEDGKSVFAIQPGGASGVPVGNTNPVSWTVDLTDTGWTIVHTHSVPSSGKYWCGYTLTGRLDATVGSAIASILVFYQAGDTPLVDPALGAPLYAVYSNCVGNTTGVTPHTATNFGVRDLPAGAQMVLLAVVLHPTGGGTLTEAVVGSLDLEWPYTIPPALGGTSLIMATGITYAKLSASADVAFTPPPPPPPPPEPGELIGKVTLDGDPAGTVGRVVTRAGASSGTTTVTADGVYYFGAITSGDYTVTLATPGGESCTWASSGPNSGSGFTGTVTVPAGGFGQCRFEAVTESPPPPPPTGTLVATVTVGGSPSAGRSLSYSGGGTFTESPTGTYTLTGVTPATGQSVSLTVPPLDDYLWTVSNPSSIGAASGDPAVAGPVTITGGGTTTVTFEG